MNHLNLSIPDPCPEDFSKMKKDERGRYCGSCARHVVDFSAMKDEEIIAYFQAKKSGEVCGTFYPHQLERTPATAKRRKLFQLRFFDWALAIFIVNGFIACKVNRTRGGAVVLQDTAHAGKNAVLNAETLSEHVDNIVSVCPPGYNTYEPREGILGGSIVIRQDTVPVKDTAVIAKKLPEDSTYLHFPSFDYILSEEDRRQLSAYAEQLKQDPSVAITISGYADGTGSQLVNKKISRRRAEVVRDFLLGQGVTNPIHLHAYGKKHPVATNRTREGRARNRRVELIITK